MLINKLNCFKAQDFKQRFKVSFAPLKIGEENEVQEEEEFETDDVKVSITTLDDNLLKSFIGVRKVIDEEEEDDNEEEEEAEGVEKQNGGIEGMDMTSKTSSKSNKMQGKTDIKSEKDYKKMVIMRIYKIPYVYFNHIILLFF